MSGEARKLHLIEAILKTEDEALLNKIETLLEKNPAVSGSEKTWKDFAGFLSEEEANEWAKNIEEGCEQIDPDGWK
jgi:hypothetical protein